MGGRPTPYDEDKKALSRTIGDHAGSECERLFAVTGNFHLEWERVSDWWHWTPGEV